MLGPGGVIIWDDYPAYNGIYAYLQEFAQRMGTTLLHVQGTRLVIYSPKPLHVAAGRAALRHA